MTAFAVIGQMVLSILAIFGLIFLFRAVFDWYFAPCAITVAVTIKSRKDADDLDILLCEAEKSVFRRRGVPMVVLVSSELMQGEIGDKEGLYPAYQDVVTAYSAAVYMISE
ncbi:MAG: hypothetical protein IJW00_11320 [Clostridia bacterium]|nr:hypothetical protein [Clostridia bacterium]MBQ9781517.1 hypothetical protein [Clostridia bacterium]